MTKIPLSLNPDAPKPGEASPHSEGGSQNNANTETDAGFTGQAHQPETAEKPTKADSDPVLGWFAVAFGLLSVFGPTIVFAPLAIICATIAMFVGQAVWAFVAYLLAVAGILTSPTLLAMFGFAAALWMFDFDALWQSIFDMLGVPGDETQQV